MADISFLSSYSKETQNEFNQIKFYLNCLYDLKTNIEQYRSSIDIDIKQLSTLYKTFSDNALIFMSELSNMENNDSSFINIAMNFGKMFDSFDKILKENFESFNSNIKDNIDSQQKTIQDVMKYITDLSSISIKDLSKVRNKYQGVLGKKVKMEKELEGSISKNIDSNIDKAISSYVDYEEFYESFNDVKVITEETQTFNDNSLKTFLIDMIIVLYKIIEETKKVLKEIVNYKRSFFKKGLNSISICLENFTKNPLIIDDFQTLYFQSKNIKQLSSEDIHKTLMNEPNSKEITDYLKALKDIIHLRKEILTSLEKFLNNISMNYDTFINSSTKGQKLYQFKTINCPVLSKDDFFPQLMDFLYNLNNLLVKKAEEFVNKNNLILPSLDGMIKELSNDECSIDNIVAKVEKEKENFTSNLNKATTQNSADLIDDCYKKFADIAKEMENDISEVVNRFIEQGKSIEQLKKGSIDNITKQLEKLFQFLVDFTGVSDSLLNKNNTEELIRHIILSTIKNENVEQYIEYIIKNINVLVEKHQFNLQNEPMISLINKEYTVNKEETIKYEVSKCLNENQVKVFNDKLQSYKEKNKKQIQKSNVLNDVFTQVIPFELKQNEIKEKSYPVYVLIEDYVFLSMLYLLNNRIVFYSIANKNKNSFDLITLTLNKTQYDFLLSNEKEKQAIILTQSSLQLYDELDQKVKDYKEAEKNNKNGSLNNSCVDDIIKKLGIGKTIKPIDLSKIIKEVQIYNMNHLTSLNSFHKEFNRHFIVDKELDYSINDNKIPIPLYMIYKVLYDPQFICLASPENKVNFILYLQRIRNDYDNIYTQTNFSPETIPSFYSDSIEHNYELFSKAQQLNQKEIQLILSDIKKFPNKQEFNYNYYHPIPNPVFMGPKLLKIDDSYSIFFVSPTCLIIEIKSQSSGFMLLDSFYTVAKYQFESEYNDDMTLKSTKLNAYFTIEFVKDNWFKNKVESNGYAENEEYMCNFVVPNMVQELQRNMKSLLEQKKDIKSSKSNKEDNKEQNKELKKESLSQYKKIEINDSIVFNDFIQGNFSYLHSAFLIIGIVILLLSMFRMKEFLLYLFLFMILIEIILLSHKLDKVYKINK